MRFLMCCLCALSLVAAPDAVAIGKAKEPKPKKEPRAEKAPKEVKKPEPLGESLCPATISVEQRVNNPPEGWEAAQSDAKMQLSMVTFFDGPPAERASLKYDRELKEKHEWAALWTLAPSARGYWLRCAYENTTGVLLRQLPAEVTNCKVIYERKEFAANGLPAIRHVACK